MSARIAQCLFSYASHVKTQRDDTHVIGPLDHLLTADFLALAEEECLAGHPSRASFPIAPLMSRTCADRAAYFERAYRCPLIRSWEWARMLRPFRLNIFAKGLKSLATTNYY